MAEKQDIQENAMGGGTPARLRGLAANGNSISPTLAEVISAMPVATETNKGLMQANGFEQGKSILSEGYNNKISAGVYSSTDNLDNMGTGILLALRGFQYTAHLYITNSARIYIKTIRSNGEILKDWTLINNT
ncbi:hypothetical protein NXV89_12315 [Bacteroides uniformis]|nr:hypothetical protein [Bacteroides uniformis]MCS2340523.1 hypothetical protein [Bacteroides uniformis]